jgi:hypothetical protein
LSFLHRVAIASAAPTLLLEAKSLVVLPYVSRAVGDSAGISMTGLKAMPQNLNRRETVPTSHARRGLKARRQPPNFPPCITEMVCLLSLRQRGPVAGVLADLAGYTAQVTPVLVGQEHDGPHGAVPSPSRSYDLSLTPSCGFNSS